MEFGGTSLKGMDKTSYVSYTVNVDGVGSGGALANAPKRSRVPLCHVEALSLDSLETGIRFEESDTVMTAVRKAHGWIKRAKAAMSRQSGMTLNVFK